MNLSRAERRRLTKRCDRLMARVRGSLMAIDVAKDWVLVREGEDGVRVVDGELAFHALASMDLADLYLEVEASRGKYGPSWVPCVVIIGDWATACWSETFHLVRGGVA